MVMGTAPGTCAETKGAAEAARRTAMVAVFLVAIMMDAMEMCLGVVEER